LSLANALELFGVDGGERVGRQKDRRGRDARRYGHDVVLLLRSGDDFIGL